jgi:hypothetical protein
LTTQKEKTSMATLAYWLEVHEREQELIQSDRARRAALAAGLPDTMAGQPLTHKGVYLTSLKNPTAATLGGGITMVPFSIAAKKLVGDNMVPTHRLSTPKEIVDFEHKSSESAAALKAAEDVNRNRRSIVVSVQEPLPREAPAAPALVPSSATAPRAS